MANPCQARNERPPAPRLLLPIRQAVRWPETHSARSSVLLGIFSATQKDERRERYGGNRRHCGDTDGPRPRLGDPLVVRLKREPRIDPVGHVEHSRVR
jgi:hypothetical protein